MEFLIWIEVIVASSWLCANADVVIETCRPRECVIDSFVIGELNTIETKRLATSTEDSLEYILKMTLSPSLAST
jgi:hypothetical protein